MPLCQDQLFLLERILLPVNLDPMSRAHENRGFIRANQPHPSAFGRKNRLLRHGEALTVLILRILLEVEPAYVARPVDCTFRPSPISLLV